MSALICLHQSVIRFPNSPRYSNFLNSLLGMTQQSQTLRASLSTMCSVLYAVLGVLSFQSVLVKKCCTISVVCSAELCSVCQPVLSTLLCISSVCRPVLSTVCRTVNVVCQSCTLLCISSVCRPVLSTACCTVL